MDLRAVVVEPLAVDVDLLAVIMEPLAMHVDLFAADVEPHAIVDCRGFTGVALVRSPSSAVGITLPPPSGGKTREEVARDPNTCVFTRAEKDAFFLFPSVLDQNRGKKNSGRQSSK
jgi:hypothetical protein